MDCCEHHCEKKTPVRGYRRALWVALAVNAVMFGIELAASFAAGSVSLRADALDFLGDAANYAVALSVAGLAQRWRARAALLKGTVMAGFGIWVAASTAIHALSGTLPHAGIMSSVAALALLANLAVAALLYRYREGDSQALSVWLCTRNDCFANLAVLLAGAGVWASGGSWPDIAVAAVIAGLSLSSATRVLKRAARELEAVPAAA